MKKNYIICTPTYGKSTGVRVLHTLAKSLQKQGFSASLFSHAPYAEGYDYVHKITDHMRENDILVYPEIVLGNPLQFKNVVRYVLCFPETLGANNKYHHSEQVFAWEDKYYLGAPILTFPYMDESIFYDDNSPKTHDCYFVYKGGQCREIPEIKDAIRIDMKYPREREELGRLLRSTKTLYSYDAESAMHNEAVACGAKVKIITPDDIIDFEGDYFRYAEKPRIQLEEFIKITQKMDYHGEIETSSTPCLKKILYKFKLFLGYLSRNARQIYKYKLKY